MFGPDSARGGMKDLPIVLCPVRLDQSRLAFWRDFFESLGLRVLHMDPDEHDHKAAFTQGITHYVGRVLADLGLVESDISTLGYTKLLEIMEQTCNDPWQLFLDLQRYNPYTKDMRTQLHRSLMRILEKLEN
jgi:prephenate dehydrogenase